jgi:hypothetical protein
MLAIMAWILGIHLIGIARILAKAPPGFLRPWCRRLHHRAVSVPGYALIWTGIFNYIGDQSLIKCLVLFGASWAVSYIAQIFVIAWLFLWVFRNPSWLRKNRQTKVEPYQTNVAEPGNI